MYSSIIGRTPLEAYETVLLFASERGESALRLSMHAAVPQIFRPDLLHLIRRNFVQNVSNNNLVTI